MLCVTERDFRVGPCCGHKPEEKGEGEKLAQ